MIYAFSSGKFQDVVKYARAKDMTNIRSADNHRFLGLSWFSVEPTNSSTIDRYSWMVEMSMFLSLSFASQVPKAHCPQIARDSGFKGPQELDISRTKFSSESKKKKIGVILSGKDD